MCIRDSFRSDIQDNSKRPILFIYNGGPGCASLWLHMGLFGPRIVKLDDELNLPTVPPFELEDNPHCLLDLCDLVFIDPVDVYKRQPYGLIEYSLILAGIINVSA